MENVGYWKKSRKLEKKSLKTKKKKEKVGSPKKQSIQKKK